MAAAAARASGRLPGIEATMVSVAPEDLARRLPDFLQCDAGKDYFYSFKTATPHQLWHDFNRVSFDTHFSHSDGTKSFTSSEGSWDQRSFFNALRGWLDLDERVSEQEVLGRYFPYAQPLSSMSTNMVDWLFMIGGKIPVFSTRAEKVDVKFSKGDGGCLNLEVKPSGVIVDLSLGEEAESQLLSGELCINLTLKDGQWRLVGVGVTKESDLHVLFEGGSVVGTEEHLRRRAAEEVAGELDQARREIDRYGKELTPGINAAWAVMLTVIGEIADARRALEILSFPKIAKARNGERKYNFSVDALVGSMQRMSADDLAASENRTALKAAASRLPRVRYAGRTVAYVALGVLAAAAVTAGAVALIVATGGVGAAVLAPVFGAMLATQAVSYGAMAAGVLGGLYLAGVSLYSAAAAGMGWLQPGTVKSELANSLDAVADVPVVEPAADRAAADDAYAETGSPDAAGYSTDERSDALEDGRSSRASSSSSGFCGSAEPLLANPGGCSGEALLFAASSGALSSERKESINSQEFGGYALLEA